MNRARRLLDDCFLHDRDRLRHADALKLLDERLKVVAGSEDVALAGGCLCGAVRIEITAAPYRVGICHCLDCRKRQGA